MTITVLLMMIMFWWHSFDLNSGAEHQKVSWSIFEYGIYIMPCLSMYLLSDLLFPENLDQVESASLHEHYLRQHREFFLLCTVNYLFFYAHNSMFYRISGDAAQSLLYLLLCGFTLPMVMWKNLVLHIVLNLSVIATLVVIATFTWTQVG